jgi:hypothetical protein
MACLVERIAHGVLEPRLRHKHARNTTIITLYQVAAPAPGQLVKDLAEPVDRIERSSGIVYARDIAFTAMSINSMMPSFRS